MRTLPAAQRRPAALLLAMLVAALATPLAHAQWKWRDKTGQVNASDRPPPMEVPERDILERPAPELRRLAPQPAAAASAAAPARQQAGERELEGRKRAADQEQAAKQKAEEERVAAQRAENCRRARTHMAALETGQRIARFDAKGERVVLDDQGRAEEVRRAREVIAADCR